MLCNSRSFRLIGNVWPPTVTLIMGVERTTACWAPLFYMKHMRKKLVLDIVVRQFSAAAFFYEHILKHQRVNHDYC